jgi:uncharacterized protein (UPF0218 family)
MDATIKAFSDYGLSGLVIAALLYGLYLIITDHKTERNEWLNAFRELKQAVEKIADKL